MQPISEPAAACSESKRRPVGYNIPAPAGFFGADARHQIRCTSHPSRSARPRAFLPHYFLAAAYGLKGELERARAELTEALRLTGSDRYSSLTRTMATGDLYTPAVRDRWETTYLPGIRAAGLPEE